MSTTPEYLSDDDQQPEGDSKPEGGVLRKQNDELRGELKSLKERVRKQEFRLAGFDPDAEEGPGALLFKAYDGEADAEQIKAFAAKHGIGTGSTDEGQQATPPELSPEERERQEAQARLQQVRSAGHTQQTPTPDDKIAEAEAKGDWRTAGTLKTQKLLAMSRPN